HMLRVNSPLTDAEEKVVALTMDCAFAVSRTLGPGFREKIYARAFCLELDSRGLPFECEKKIAVRYKQWLIPGQTVDLIVAGLVLVEIKAVPQIRQIHRVQVLSYLKTMGLRVGLLMNFNTVLLKDNLFRIVNSHEQDVASSHRRAARRVAVGACTNSLRVSPESDWEGAAPRIMSYDLP
ncbi:MAG: GxxExxY protein, partial [Vicinamibacterales bacterium]